MARKRKNSDIFNIQPLQRRYKNHPILYPFKDKDRDRVKNVFDCQPLNRRKHGIIPSRPRCKSCVHATQMCSLGCYNKNVENYGGKGVKLKDIKNEEDWNTWGRKQWREDLESKAFLKSGKPVVRKIPEYSPILHGPVSHQKRKIDRLRLMERGEAFRDTTDIKRVQNILEEFPKSKVWIPTRAWRDKPMRRKIEDEIMGSYPNERIHASLDPSNIDEPDKLEGIQGKWRTMYFGSDKVLKNPLNEEMVKCPKTWEHKYGACQECDTGCFRKDEVHVHLKSHGLQKPAKEYIKQHEQRIQTEHPDWLPDEDDEQRVRRIEKSIDDLKDDP